MNILSVVCARSGSKGLNNKCVTRINNKMVVEYSIEYSLSLGKDVKTVVSTDIEELIAYCKKKEVDFIKRDPVFCADDSRIDDALADVIERYGADYQLCSLVYGNIPTRYPALFHKGVAFLIANNDYDAAISMQNVEKYNPAWMFDFNEAIVAREKIVHYRRQDLPQKMIPDGHTLIFRVNQFFDKYKGALPYESEYRYSIFGTKIKPIINNEVIVDIDTSKDLKLAEAVILCSRLA